MVYTITFNPAIDYIARVANLELGRTNRTTEELMHPGGKGINVAIVLKHLDIPTKALAFVGGFTGNALIEMLQEQNLPIDFIHCQGNTRINVKIKEKIETEINGQGIVIEQQELKTLYTKLQCLQEGDCLILSGSIPKGMSNTLYADIMQQLKGKNIEIVVDATGELLCNTLKYGPFLIKPNIQEMEELFNVTIKKNEDIAYYAKKLQEKGARNIIVSMGGDGALMLTEKGELLTCTAPKGQVIDTVGADDSMVAGFIAGYMQTKNYKKALQLAVATGSATAYSVWLAEKELIYQLKNEIEERNHENS